MRSPTDGSTSPIEIGEAVQRQSLNSMCLSKTMLPFSFFTML